MHDATVSLLEGAALAFLASGEPPPRIGNAHYSIAPFDTFSCADRPIIICAANDTLFAGLCGALGRHELIAEERFRSNAGRHALRDELKAELESVLRERPSEFWLERLNEAGVPAGPVSDVAEAMSSEQVAARRMVIRAGGMPMPGSPMKLSAYPDPDERPAAPELDQHGAQLRAEFLANGRAAAPVGAISNGPAPDGATADGPTADGPTSDGAVSEGGAADGCPPNGSRREPTADAAASIPDAGSLEAFPVTAAPAGSGRQPSQGGQ
jgi:CoA:oxalate CoA-transferase